MPAVPANRIVGCLSGGAIACGRIAVPAWLSGANVGEWLAIPNSSLSSSGVGWAGASPGGSGTYTKIVDAWGGGVLNTVGVFKDGAFQQGTFFVIFGGGHNDYAGNELYAFGPLQADSPTWSRLTDPTIPAAVNTPRINGYPVSRHSYDTLVYLPTLNKMLCVGAAGIHSNGYSQNAGDLYDFSANPDAVNPWSGVDTDFPAYNGGGIGVISLVSGYSTTSNSAWGLGLGNSQKIGRFNADTQTWQSWSIDNPSMATSSKAGLSSALSIMAVLSNDQSVMAVDLRSAPSIYTPSVTGTGPSTGGMALDWDARLGKFTCWSKSGKTIYSLTPGANPYAGGDAWVWESHTPSGGATPANPPTYAYVFGRYRTVDVLGIRGYLLMSATNSAIHFYKSE